MSDPDKILADLMSFCEEFGIEQAEPAGLALGLMMRDWLQNAVVDSGTVVDVASGMRKFDLWATVEGEEYFITIHKAKFPKGLQQ